MTTPRVKAASGLLAKTAEREAARVGKTLEQDVVGLLEEAGQQAKKVPAKKGLKGAAQAAGALVRSAPKAVVKKVEDILQRFGSEVELYAEVERGRKALLSGDTKRTRFIERFKRQAADSKLVNEILNFGLKPHQAKTLDEMLGQFFGQEIKLIGSKETRKAQQKANELIAGMKGHWDAAMPKGKTRAQALRDVWNELQAARKLDPDLNPSTFVRKKLFDPWRKEFMKRLGDDHALVAELKSAAGIEILTDSDVPRFSLEVKVGGKKVQFGFDVDHAEQRLSDAVRSAKRPEDLLSVIDSEGMQLLTPRENRRTIEAFRKATREYFANAKEEAVKYFKRIGADPEELNAEIDRMVDALDRPGDWL